jgi:phasin family protein
MTQQFGKHAFDQADKLFKGVLVPSSFQAFAEQGVAASKNFYEKTAAAAQDRGQALTEIGDTAWDSTKSLNEMVVQNLGANFQATFAAAQAIAAAKSLPEIAKLQSDFIQMFTAQLTEQTKEFVGLSTRASRQVLEKVQALNAKSFKPVA